MWTAVHQEGPMAFTLMILLLAAITSLVGAQVPIDRCVWPATTPDSLCYEANLCTAANANGGGVDACTNSNPPLTPLTPLNSLFQCCDLYGRCCELADKYRCYVTDPANINTQLTPPAVIYYANPCKAYGPFCSNDYQCSIGERCCQDVEMNGTSGTNYCCWDGMLI